MDSQHDTISPITPVHRQNPTDQPTNAGYGRRVVPRKRADRQIFAVRAARKTFAQPQSEPESPEKEPLKRPRRGHNSIASAGEQNILPSSKKETYRVIS